MSAAGSTLIRWYLRRLRRNNLKASEQHCSVGDSMGFPSFFFLVLPFLRRLSDLAADITWLAAHIFDTAGNNFLNQTNRQNT